MQVLDLLGLKIEADLEKLVKQKVRDLNITLKFSYINRFEYNLENKIQ